MGLKIPDVCLAGKGSSLGDVGEAKDGLENEL